MKYRNEELDSWMLPPISTDFPSIQDTLYSLGLSITLKPSLQAISRLFLCGLIVLGLSLRHFPCILSLDQEIHSLRETGHWALADVLIGNGVADAVTMLCKTQRALFREMEFSFTVSNRQSNFYTSWLRS